MSQYQSTQQPYNGQQPGTGYRPPQQPYQPPAAGPPGAYGQPQTRPQQPNNAAYTPPTQQQPNASTPYQPPGGAINAGRPGVGGLASGIGGMSLNSTPQQSPYRAGPGQPLQTAQQPSPAPSTASSSYSQSRPGYQPPAAYQPPGQSTASTQPPSAATSAAPSPYQPKPLGSLQSPQQPLSNASPQIQPGAVNKGLPYTPQPLGQHSRAPSNVSSAPSQPGYAPSPAAPYSSNRPVPAPLQPPTPAIASQRPPVPQSSYTPVQSTPTTPTQMQRGGYASPAPPQQPQPLQNGYNRDSPPGQRSSAAPTPYQQPPPGRQGYASQPAVPPQQLFDQQPQPQQPGQFPPQQTNGYGAPHQPGTMNGYNPQQPPPQQDNYGYQSQQPPSQQPQLPYNPQLNGYGQQPPPQTAADQYNQAAGYANGQPSYATNQVRQNSRPKNDRIDARQIPRPDFRASGVVQKYYTRSGMSPPAAYSDFVVIDEGNCSPRFIRMTTNSIGINAEIVESTKLSIGAVLQPLAPLAPGESPIPIIDYPSGPVRCNRCMAYVNAGFQFIDGGSRFICNICSTKNDVPEDYRSNLDANGYRRDRYDRPELCRGSVEFVVGPEFLNKPVNDPTLLFVIDVSFGAVVSGLVDTTVQAIRSIIDARAVDEKQRIGIITYDNSVQFYRLKPGVSTEPSLYVMADGDDPFVPCPPDEIIVRPSDPDSKALLNATLDMIASLYTKQKITETLPAMGAAVSAAIDTLVGWGGKILLTQTGLPQLGCGKLSARDNSALYYTEKEKTLQVPQSPFYDTIATTAADNAITVDLFLCANSYIDIATIGVLCEKTGGQIYSYPGFHTRKDGLALARDLYHDSTRITGHDAVMIVRCSAGLRVAELYGNFYHKRALEMDLPSIDEDKAFGLRLEHDGQLKDKSEVCIQAALLYTTHQGDRRIRVHTICLPTTGIMSNLFRFADLDSIINLSLKQAVRQLQDTTTSDEAQKAITSACIDSLYMYRKHCAASTSAGQLILPEPLKLLPLSTIALIKHPLLQDGIPADERAFLYQYVSSMPVNVSVAFVCPRLFALHDMAYQRELCLPDQEGRVQLPQTLQLSSAEISRNGIYLLDDSRFVYIYIGPDAAQELLTDMFDVTSQQAVGHSSSQYKLKTGESPEHLSSRIGVLIETLRRQKPYYQNTQIIVSGQRQQQAPPQQGGFRPGAAQSVESLDEAAFFDHLIEDSVTNPRQTIAKPDPRIKNPNTMAYVDFLVWLHRKIQLKFTE